MVFIFKHHLNCLKASGILARIAFLLLVSTHEPAHAQSQLSGTQKAGGQFAVTQSAIPTSTESANGGSADSFVAPSRKALFSLGLSFGAQSGPYGRESAGFRLGLLDELWAGLFLQASLNEKAKQQAFGVHLELGLDIMKQGRALLSIVPVLAYGQSSNTEKKETQVQWGASLGLQLEVFLLREVSTALKIDLGGQFEPAEEMRLSTASSELMLFYHL